MSKKEYFYILTNISMPGLVKVGITDDLNKRINHLSKTNMPTRFQVYATFEKFTGGKLSKEKVADPGIIESEVLERFKNERENKKKEFLKIHPEVVIAFVEDIRKKVADEEQVKGLFKKLKLNKGDKLYFKDRDDKVHTKIYATIETGRDILYDGKKTSFSKSAHEILNKRFKLGLNSYPQGTVHWAFKNKNKGYQTIRELMDEEDIR